MKIYILADMEGISGIRKIEQVQTDKPAYEEGRQLMMADMNASIDAAFSAGATEVVASDTHGGGGQFRLHDMDPRAIYETPGGDRLTLLPSLDKSFKGVILLGHHAKAGTLNAFLDHTMSSVSWFDYRLGGRSLGEIGIEAAWAGHYGVPVVAVTGDQATADEAKALLGRVECAVVKRGIGRNNARCLSIPAAHEAIRKAITDALRSIGSFKPFKPRFPAPVQMTFYRSDYADSAVGFNPDIERVDARTIRKQARSALDLMF
jgi:D-amino peptidase